MEDCHIYETNKNEILYFGKLSQNRKDDMTESVE